MPAPFNALRAALIGAALTTAIPLPAHADIITRGCFGSIYVTSDDFLPRRLVEIDARGTCEGRRNANRCRERAHDLLRRCIDAVRDEWAQHDIPDICRPSSGLRTGMNQFEYQGVLATLPNGNTSIEDRITYASCCSGGGRLGSHDVSVDWQILGDVGCYGHTRPRLFTFEGGTSGHLWETISTHCTAAWDAGICTGTRPTQGTRTNPTE